MHEERTGDWVFRTTEWNAWLVGKTRCCWIHGIPGAGKSVLASYLIQQLTQHCAGRERCATVFYYCYYGNNQDESDPLLRWLISQLSRRSASVPPEMVYVYDQNHAPGRAQLLSILEVVLGSFDTVFFVVDALDESEPRHALLDLIRTLVTESRFRNIQLLTTSREYLDIKEVMTEVSIRLPMDHEITKNDIRVYVRSVLNTTREFKRWPVEFRLRVEQKLTDGAKGM